MKEAQDKRNSLPHSLPSNPPTLVPSQHCPSPPTLSQSSPLSLQTSRPREEGLQQHLSVIQSTGLAASSKPLALLTQPRRETSPSPLSASPIPLITSPKGRTTSSPQAAQATAFLAAAPAPVPLHFPVPRHTPVLLASNLPSPHVA
ncbi:bromodomain adjacent to zinc finger domain protein 2B, partial [Salmo salar]|uniref:Bromodomain adjacent to zinc finger domain protein 2B n=1 Tax=Salmo salar TaxID=8030 RepID=A0ABM3DBZ9_SALSA